MSEAISTPQTQTVRPAFIARLPVELEGIGIGQRMVCLIVLASSLALLAQAVRVINSDVADWYGVEQSVTYGIGKVLTGAPLYTRLDEPPFDVIQYGPVYYYLCAAVCRVCGIGAWDAVAITACGRIVSLVSMAGFLTLNFVMLRRFMGASTWFALTVCGVLHVVNVPFGFLCRSDSLAMFLMGLSLLVALEAVSRGTAQCPWLWATAAAIGVLATAVKQDCLQINGLFVLALALERRWREAACVLLVTVSGMLIYMGLGIAVFGAAFLENIIGGVQNGTSLRAAMTRVYGPFFVRMAPVVVAAAIAARHLCRISANRGVRLLTVWLIVTFLVGCVSALKIGAADFYLLKFLAIACLMIAWAIRQCLLDSRPVAGHRTLLAALMLFIAMFVPARTIEQLRGMDSKPRYSTYTEVTEFLNRQLAGSPGAFVAFGSAKDEPMANLLHRTAVMPTGYVSYLIQQQQVTDYSHFRECVESGRVRFLVLSKGQRPAWVCGVDFTGFLFHASVGGYDIFQCPAAK